MTARAQVDFKVMRLFTGSAALVPFVLLILNPLPCLKITGLSNMNYRTHKTLGWKDKVSTFCSSSRTQCLLCQPQCLKKGSRLCSTCKMTSLEYCQQNAYGMGYENQIPCLYHCKQYTLNRSTGTGLCQDGNGGNLALTFTISSTQKGK